MKINYGKKFRIKQNKQVIKKKNDLKVNQNND